MAIASAIFTLGLHRGSDATNPPSFLVSEDRKQTFCVIFSMHKGLSTFTGRPPSLSRRCVNCQLPLDLSPIELIAEGEVLSQAIARLDSDGWNTHGAVYFLPLFVLGHY